jgi:hypothetical protein
MLGGTDATRKFISSKKSAWKWWSSPDKLIRPQVAITVVDKDDKYEAGKPESGLNIRVRCRWNSVREALKTPAVTLQELKIDGQIVAARDTVIKNKRGLIADAYYLYVWGTPTKGKHQVEATIKNLNTNAAEIYTQTYVQN